jgi:triosephosphate isomerase (TIM)
MNMRRKIIAANWKMNMTVNEAEGYLDTFLLELGDEKRLDVVILPPFTALPKVSERLMNVQNVKLGAQNMHWEKPGAFTGEICAPMLRELFVRYVVLGHSERRTYFSESDEFVNKKTKAVLAATMTPIVCIGETLDERDAGKVESVLDTQLRGSLADLTPAQLADVVLAYEPVWAIGTGRTATPEQAQEAHGFIRTVLTSMSDAATAAKVRIQYGGSVKPANTAELMAQEDIDGALVGGASLDPRGFAEIIKTTCALFD